MKSTIEEYGFFALYTIVGIIVIAMLFGLIFGEDDNESLSSLMPANAEEHKTTGDYTEYNNGLPILETNSYIEVQLEGDELDLLSDEFVHSATDANGNDISDNVYVMRIINKETGEKVTEIPNNVAGTYEVTYVLKDDENQRVKSTMLLIVNVTVTEEEEEELP